MELADRIHQTEQEARQGKLSRREFLRLTGAGITAALANPLIGYGRQTQQVEQTPAREMPRVATYYPMYYYLGNMDYAEGEYDIPLDWIMSRTVKNGDSLWEWIKTEEEDFDKMDVFQRAFLQINDRGVYPKGYNRNFKITERNIKLPVGKKVNFIDFNHDGKILGEPAEYVPLADLDKLLHLKNNWGEWY